MIIMLLKDVKDSIMEIRKAVLGGYPDIGKYVSLRGVGMWELCADLAAIGYQLEIYEDYGETKDLETALSIFKEVITVLENELKEFPMTIESLALRRIVAQLHSYKIEVQLYFEKDSQ